MVNAIDKKLSDAMQQLKAIKEQARVARLAVQQQKKALVVEYTGQLTDEQKANIINECQTQIDTAKKAVAEIKQEFRNRITEHKQSIAMAKERLSLLSYTISNGLPRVKRQFAVNGNFVEFTLESGNKLMVNHTTANWQNDIREKIAKEMGIDKNDGILRNWIYKASLAVKANS